MKTHEEKLNELKNAIRQSIPRLMELTKGQKFIIKNIPFEYEFLCFINDDEFVDEIAEIATFYNGEIDTFDYQYFKNQDYTIIGHEPLLNDVLEWLGYNHAIVAGGGFLMKNREDMNFKCIQVPNVNEYRHLKWDLTKSKLKDQSPELIDFLHELIPTK